MDCGKFCASRVEEEVAVCQNGENKRKLTAGKNEISLWQTGDKLIGYYIYT